MLARVSRPPWSVLGRTVDEESDDVAFQSLESHPEAETFPGLLIIRFDADLFFANANVFADDVREALAAADPKPSVVLFDAESVSDIDSTAIMVMRDLRAELESVGIELWTARIKTRVRETIDRVDGDDFGRLFTTVRVAVKAFQEREASDEAAAPVQGEPPADE